MSMNEYVSASLQVSEIQSLEAAVNKLGNLLEALVGYIQP